MFGKLARSLAAMAVVALACPGIAAAGTVEYRRTVTSVSGPEAAAQALGTLRGVQLGATAATITLDVEGVAREVRFDFGAIETDVTGAERPMTLQILLVVTVLSTLLRTGRALVATARR